MADSPTPNPIPTSPSLPPQAPILPQAPAAPQPPVAIPSSRVSQVTSNDDAVESDQSSSPLSPFRLLAKQPQQTAQVIPPPATGAPMKAVVNVPLPPQQTAQPLQPQTPQAAQPLPAPSSPQPSREELLQQAAEAPAASFILPPPEVIATQKPQAPLTAFQTAPAPRPPVAQKPPAPIPPKPAVQPLGTPAAPLPGQQKPFINPAKAVVPNAPKQMGAPLPQTGIVSRIPGRVTPAIQNSLSNAVAQGNFAPARKKRNLTGIFLLVAAISLILGAGAAYVMAKNGTRVPVLYKQVSGLEPTGLASAKQALGYTEARTSYQVQGEIELVDKDFLDASGKPKLLAPGEVEAGTVYRVKAEIGQAEAREKGVKVMSSIALTINQNDPLPVSLRSGGETNKSDARAYFAASTNPEVVSFSQDLVAKTLLAPVLTPIPLEKLLAIPTGELAYKKQTGGKANTIVSAHSFTVNLADLQPYFPKDATLENFTVIHRYSWMQGSIPAAQTTTTELRGTVTYKQKKYAYTSDLRYGNWDKQLETSVDSSGSLAKLVAATTPKAIGIASVVAQAGILNLDSLPNTLSEEEKGSAGTTVVPPTENPPASTAITPSGEGITTPGTKILGNPVIPATPASAEAKVRDAQRVKDLADLKKALIAYKAAKGLFPVSLSRIQTIEGGVLLSELVDTYLTKLPIDPTKSIYWYEYSSDGNRFTLRAVAEDPQSASAIKGLTYSYFEVTN